MPPQSDTDHDPEFEALTGKISRERGFGCSSYKEKCLRRRIAVRMRARGVHRYEDYARLLDADGAEYDRLLDALTINVTKLFRNWEVFAAISEKVIPALWNREELPRIKVWSAGCASGEEPYSLAVLFHRHAATNGMLAQLPRVDVLGTDIDRRSLDAASLGEFAEGDFADTPAELRARYFEAEAPFRIANGPRSIVRFASHDLLRDAAPSECHLLTCRNVLIYFDRDTQERLFDTFYRALAPGGFLVLGKVETLLGASRSRFATVDSRERIFRKI